MLNALAFYPEPERKNEDRARMTITGATDTVVDSFPHTITFKEENQPVTVLNESDMPLFLSIGSKLFLEEPEEDTTDFRVTTHWSVSGGMRPDDVTRPGGGMRPDDSVSQGSGGTKDSVTGQEISVRSGIPVTLTARVEFFKSAEYVVIEIPVPSGFAYNEKKDYRPGEVHREFYRDHVAIFIRHATPGIRTFEITLMPRFTGRFVMNPAKVSLMYFPVICSNNELKRVIIN